MALFWLWPADAPDSEAFIFASAGTISEKVPFIVTLK
jgi:hypothetical protein